jgi:hypothetical protein
MADFTTAARTWLTQSTTGQGASVLLAAATGLLTHSVPPGAALAAAVAGAFLVVFPQSTAAAPIVQRAATDAEAAVAAFRAGLTHGMTLQQSAVAALPTAEPLLGDVADLVAALRENTTATNASAAAIAAPPAPAPAPAPIPVSTVGGGGATS